MVKIKKKWHHKEVLEGMYIDQNLTMRQIGEILGITASTVKYWMDKFDVLSREFHIGDINKGIKRTEDEKAYLSQVAKARFKTKEDHPMYGKRHSEYSKRKMSETKRRNNLERKTKRL